MAELAISIAVSTVADTLSKVLIQESAVLSGVAKEVEWIERELRLMQAYLDDFDHGEEEEEEGFNQWAEEMKNIALEAEEVIGTFVIKSVKRRWTFSLVDRYKLGKELEHIKKRISDISPRGMNDERQTRIGVTVETPGPGETAASPSTSTMVAPAAAAVEKLSHVLNRHLVTSPKVIKTVEEVRDEVVNLKNIVSNLNQRSTSEREKVWLEEVKGVCNLTVHEARNFITRSERWSGTGRVKQVISSLVGYVSQREFRKQMKNIKTQIGDALYRKLIYGVGVGEEDMGNKIGSRSRPVRSLPWERLIIAKVPSLAFYIAFLLFPDHVRSEFAIFFVFFQGLVLGSDNKKFTSLKAFLFIVLVDAVAYILAQVLHAWVSLLLELGSILYAVIVWMVSLLRSMEKNLKSTKRDVELMHALFHDIQGAQSLNKRQEVWVDQLISVAEKCQHVITAYGEGRIFSRFKFAKDFNGLLNEILNISGRKTIYGIANIQGRRGSVSLDPGPSIQETESETNSGGTEEHSPPHAHAPATWPVEGLKGKVQSIRGELKLMNALFQDVEEMGELHGRSRLWLEDMRAIATETQSVINEYERKLEDKPIYIHAFKYRTRLVITRKINKIRSKIQDASRRRKTYGCRLLLTSRNASAELNQEQKPWIEIFNLPLDLRRCLFHFVQFPAEFGIPARRLVALWVAEGLVRHEQVAEGLVLHGEDNEPPEQVAERYLTELIDLNMVQVAQRKRNGKVKTCRLPNDLRELWLKKANDSRFLQGHRVTDSDSNPKNSIIRRVADHRDQNDIWHNHIHPSTRSASASPKTYYKDVLSFLSFDGREGSKPGQDIGNFLNLCISSNCFLLLRVLDLESVFKPKLPENIARLSRLRYLGLRWTYLESLPSSISSLLKLQTLDLKHTYINTLTSSIWKMQLRHLFLSETYRSKFPRQPKGNSLSEIQTLWGLFVDEETPIKGGLDKLLNIRKLGLACQSMSLDSLQPEAMRSQLDAVADWLMNLKCLQALRLKSRDEEGRPWDLHLKSLKNSTNLTDMYLLGRLSTSSVLSEFPPSLVELTLSHSELEDDPMQILQYLPNLRSLCLLAESYVGKMLVCNPQSFPQLHVLKFWNLEQLEEWKIEAEALPCLRQLEIRSCRCLKMLPDGLEHVATLLELKLTNMPMEINSRVSNTNSEDWHKISHIRNVCIDD